MGKGAICFDEFTCDFQGFVCKSDMIDLGNRFDGLASRYNDLLDKSKELADNLDETVGMLDQTNACVDSARTLDEAKSCLFQ